MKSNNVSKEFTAPGSVSGDHGNLITSTVSKDYSNSVSCTSSEELLVSDSVSKSCSKSVSASVSKNTEVSKSVSKDLNCTSKKLKCNDSKDDNNLESNSVSKRKRVIDATTKTSGHTEPNKISKKTKYDSIKSSNAHKSKQTDPKKVNPHQKSPAQSVEPVKIAATTTTHSAENKMLKATYVNSKALQKFIPTKRSRGLVLRAKPSLLLKYKAIDSVELKSQS